MRKQRKRKAEETIAVRLWSFAAAKAAVPYLRSLVRSLREGWLEMRQAQEQVRKIEARPGHADRETLILLAETNQDVSRAETKLEEIINDMVALSAFCVDPAAGLAVIPGMSKGVLAWFIFDLFDDAGLVAWRLHTDSLETRRPLAEFEETGPSDTSAAMASFSPPEQTAGGMPNV